MAFIISRMSTERGRPPGFCAGIKGSKMAHSVFVRSLITFKFVGHDISFVYVFNAAYTQAHSTTEVYSS